MAHTGGLWVWELKRHQLAVLRFATRKIKRLTFDANSITNITDRTATANPVCIVQRVGCMCGYQRQASATESKFWFFRLFHGEYIKYHTIVQMQTINRICAVHRSIKNEAEKSGQIEIAMLVDLFECHIRIYHFHAGPTITLRTCAQRQNYTSLFLGVLCNVDCLFVFSVRYISCWPMPFFVFLHKLRIDKLIIHSYGQRFSSPLCCP